MRPVVSLPRCAAAILHSALLLFRTLLPAILFSAFAAADARAKRWFIPEIPSSITRIRNLPIECQFFGSMYSFEWSIADFLRRNANQFLVDDPYAADLILLPHCVTFLRPNPVTLYITRRTL